MQAFLSLLVFASLSLGPWWLRMFRLATLLRRAHKFTGSMRYLAAPIFLSVYFVGTAAAAIDRPPPTDRPTRVSLGLFLLDVLAIDDSEQTITIDFGVSARWIDARLADKAGQVIPLEDAWAPNLQIISNKNLRLTRPSVLHITEGGKVESLQRYIGEIWHASDLSNFPLDNQTFSIQLITPGNTPQQIRFVENRKKTGQSDTWKVFGWDRFSGHWKSDPFFFQPAQEQFAGAAYVFTAHRKQGYYYWKVIIPLSLVILMSGAVFWIDASNSSSQISVAYTAILTLVAYRFLIGNMVPEISYMTRLDRFMLGASILVFCVLGEAIWTGRLAARGKLATSTRVDYWCRWIFLAAFIVIALVAFVF